MAVRQSLPHGLEFLTTHIRPNPRAKHRFPLPGTRMGIGEMRLRSYSLRPRIALYCESRVEEPG